MKRRWRPGSLIGLALLLALGAMVLVGCGGSSSSSSESSTSASSSGSESSGSEGSEGSEGKGGMFNISEEAEACLKEKGVELPEGKSGEGGPPSGGYGEMPEGGEKPEGGEMPEGGEKPEGGEPPSGGEGGFGGEGSEEQQKAFEECGVETPEFKGGAGGGKPNTDSAAFKKQVKEYVACVRENGYEIAEPNFSGEGPIFEKSESESAAFKKASKKCESLLKGSSSGSSSSESSSEG
ncbi:MAG: hypothetical protein QM729_05375 [Solirubrobacterales bacterium]